MSTWIPTRWPKDQPYHSGEQFAATSARLDALVSLKWQADYTPHDGRQSLRTTARFGGRTYELQVVSPSIDVTTPGAAFMTASTGEALDAQVGELFRYLPIRGREVRLLPDPLRRSGLPYYGAYSVRLIASGTVIGTSSGTWSGTNHAPFALQLSEEAQARAAAAGDDIEIEITGDASEAFRPYLLDWKGPAIAWTGKVKVRPMIDRLP